MKTPEERQTAWIDDALSPEERAAFEAGQPDLSALQAEKVAAQQLRSLLQKTFVPATLASPDFFNHGIMEAIAKEEAATAKPSNAGRGLPWFLQIGRLAWAGVALMAVAALLTANMIPFGESGPSFDAQAQVEEMKVAEPGGVSAVAFYATSSDLTVLWIDGMEYVPASHALN